MKIQEFSKNNNRNYPDIPRYMLQKWQNIVNILTKIIQVPAALIMRVEPPYIEVFRSSESKHNPYRIGDKEKLYGLYCETVINTKEKLLVPNALKNKKWNKNPDIKIGMISYLGFPILWPDKHVFGTICVLDNKENKYNEDYIELLKNFKNFLETQLQLIEFNQKLKQKVEERTKELKESEEKFRTIAEQSLMGIAVLQNNVFKYVNQQYGDIFGYTIEELNSFQPGEFSKLVHPKDRDMTMEQERKKQKGLEDIINHYQIRSIKKTGETGWIEILLKTIPYEGRPADLITIIDITEKKKAEEELKRLNKLKTELLIRSSHELKTPLMSIKGFTELLLLKYKETLQDDEISLTNGIRKGCFRLEALIEDILKTAELESGIFQLEKSEDDLSFLIRACKKELQGFADSRNQNINLMLNDKLETYLDRMQIQQVINNLLTNAIKYTPPNGEIKIYSEIKEDFFIISIKDSGIGFNEEEKQRVFKRFGKIERYGQGYDVVSEGSGLGLYISKKIVELHGGKIWVESEGRNKGSIFYFSLPIMTK